MATRADLKTSELTNEQIDKKLESFVEIVLQQQMDTHKELKKQAKRIAALEKQQKGT